MATGWQRRVTSVLPVALIAATFSLASARAHADDDSVKNLELRLEGQCDEKNSRLWLINTSSDKSIIASLRWSLANSKRIIKDRFQIGPSGKLEIGCAAKADIASAQYAPPPQQ